MSGGWEGSTRRDELPAEWPKIRAGILERDKHRCRWIVDGVHCGHQATEVDHIGDRYDHTAENLQALCRWHHAKKTGAQGGGSPNQKRVTNRRAAERHPGLM